MLQPFAYFEPTDLEEASALLMEHGPHARLLAGGTWLLVLLERRLATARAVINLKAVPELADAAPTPKGGLRLGALTRVDRLAAMPEVRQAYPALAQAAAAMATPHVRRRATLGGNLCSQIPFADLAVALLALEARVEVFGPRGRRTIPLTAFYEPWGPPVLAPGEVLVAVSLPAASGRSWYERFTVRQAADVVLANVAVSLEMSEGRILRARIAIGADGPRPARALGAERLLEGQAASPDLFAAAAEAAATAANLADDWRASRDYRRHLLRVLTSRALQRAAA